MWMICAQCMIQTISSAQDSHRIDGDDYCQPRTEYVPNYLGMFGRLARIREQTKFGLSTEYEG